VPKYAPKYVPKYTAHSRSADEDEPEGISSFICLLYTSILVCRHGTPDELE